MNRRIYIFATKKVFQIILVPAYKPLLITYLPKIQQFQHGIAGLFSLVLAELTSFIFCMPSADTVFHSLENPHLSLKSSPAFKPL